MMKSSPTSLIALVVALTVAASLHSAVSSLVNQERLSDGICGNSCNPQSVHGCKGLCYVCDPVDRICVGPKKDNNPVTPPKPKPKPPPSSNQGKPPSSSNQGKPPSSSNQGNPPSSSNQGNPPPPAPGPSNPTGAAAGDSPSADASKCFGIIRCVKVLAVRSKPNQKAAILSYVPDPLEGKKIELKNQRKGENVNGNDKWYSYEGGWVTGKCLDIQPGGPPKWCV